MRVRVRACVRACVLLLLLLGGGGGEGIYGRVAVVRPIKAAKIVATFTIRSEQIITFLLLSRAIIRHLPIGAMNEKIKSE
jgi:hypothetical protein